MKILSMIVTAMSFALMGIDIINGVYPLAILWAVVGTANLIVCMW